MLGKKDAAYADMHLDAIRGLAALIVVLGHARGLFFRQLVAAPSQAPAEQASALTLNLGYEAVLVFFVLSGFLVGGSVWKAIEASRWRWTDYLIRRLVRLWIVLIPAIFIGALLDVGGLALLGQEGSIYRAPPGQDMVQPGNLDTLSSPAIILGNVLFLQSILVPEAGSNLVLWSLANEFWYYLLFPMILLALQPSVKPLARLGYAVGAAAIFVLIGAHKAYLFLPWVMGAAVSRLPSPPARFPGLTMLVASAIFLLVFVGLKKLHLPLAASEMLIAVLSAGLIYLARRHTGVGTGPFAWIYARVSSFFSQISYSLYLTHLPVMIFICAAINNPWAPWPLTPTTALMALCVCMAAIAWAWLVYLLFESHTDRARRFVAERLAPRRTEPSLAASAAPRDSD